MNPQLQAHERTLLRWWEVGNENPANDAYHTWRQISHWCDGARAYCFDMRMMEIEDDFHLASQLARTLADMENHR